MSSDIEFVDGRLTLTVGADSLEMTVWNEDSEDWDKSNFQTLPLPREEVVEIVSHMQRFLDITAPDMKIRDNCEASTGDFWYDLTLGGHLKPREILEREEDIREVERAIRILQRFQSACEDQYRRLRGTMTSDADLRESNVHGKHIRGRSVQVTDKAEVSGQASVSDNATVSDFALVNGYAKVSDNASVAEFSVVSGNTSVSGCAFIQEHSHVSGNAVVRDRAVVSEHAHVYEHAVVHGESIVEGMARIKGSAKIGGTSVVSGKTTVSGNASVSGAANVSGRSSILGNASVSEEASVSGCAIVTGNASVSGKALVHGYAVVTGNARISGDAVILGGTWDGSEGEITSGRWLSPKVSAML